MSSNEANSFGFAVMVKTDCPHLEQHVNFDLVDNNSTLQKKLSDPCSYCDSKEENWMCLKCGDVCCSRYVNGDMKKHGTEKNHNVGISFSDMSVWCYECNEYIDNKESNFQKLLQIIKDSKFPPENEEAQKALEEENEKLLYFLNSKK
eukprot:gene8541-365_t